MKNIYYTLAFLLLSISASAQLATISTYPSSLLKKNYKTFVIMDEQTGMTLSKTPVLYNSASPMPLNYFTNILPNGNRTFIIHSLETSSTAGAQDWVLEYNAEENEIFFARNKYIKTAASKHWTALVTGEKVVFKNQRTHSFLYIDENGKYTDVETLDQATQWKLIYAY